MLSLSVIFPSGLGISRIGSLQVRAGGRERGLMRKPTSSFLRPRPPSYRCPPEPSDSIVGSPLSIKPAWESIAIKSPRS